MRKWPRLLACALEAFIVLAVVYFEPTFRVRGRLHGEAFFDDRPTSYWRALVLSDLEPSRPRWWNWPLERFSAPEDSAQLSRLIRDLEADDVLRELADDPDDRVADFARRMLTVHASDRAEGTTHERDFAVAIWSFKSLLHKKPTSYPR